MTRLGSVCDAVVFGAGLGGLAAAAFLSKAGRRALVVDRLDGPGGYAHTFQRAATAAGASSWPTASF